MAFASRYLKPLPGHIYAFSHERFPGLLKIGKTTISPEARCGELSKILPEPFAVEYAATVSHTSMAETWVHFQLAHCRVNPRREWFQISVEDAKEEQVTYCKVTQRPAGSFLSRLSRARMSRDKSSAYTDEGSEERVGPARLHAGTVGRFTFCRHGRAFRLPE